MKLKDLNIPAGLHNQIRMIVAQEIVADLEQYGGTNASQRVRKGYIPRLQERMDRVAYWESKTGAKANVLRHHSMSQTTTDQEGQMEEAPSGIEVQGVRR